MKNLERKGLHGHVVDEIGRRIVSGELAAGEPLPSEAELCTTLGVSRTALREALRVLAAKGLVEPRPKRGTLVRSSHDWNFLDADMLAWRLDSKTNYDRVVDELYELRHLIEPIAAALAAKNATAGDLEQIREAYEEMAEAGDDGKRLHGPDLRFHRSIIRASGNALFSSLAHVLNAALSVNFDIVADDPLGHVVSLPDHRKVMDAIASRNESAARLAMQRLINYSQGRAGVVMGKRGGEQRPANGRVKAQNR